MSAPGTAAPQCGNSDDQTGAYSSEGRTGVRRSQDTLMRQSQEHRDWYSRGYLPHFDTPHVIQHITYHLADSLPREAVQRMQAEIASVVQGDEKRKTELRRRIEFYLNAGHGSCVLKEPEVAACVVDTWHRFDGERYRLLEWMVMPNHCHVLIEPMVGIPLGKIVLSWKNYTGRFIGRWRERTGVCAFEGRTGVRRSQAQIWHREYWDRFIRGEQHFLAVRDYIVMNPVKAGLVRCPEDWLWSSARDRVDDGGER